VNLREGLENKERRKLKKKDVLFFCPFKGKVEEDFG
jgi:hypothetical protein